MPPQPPPSTAAKSREFRQRVLTCLHKLSDRDTFSGAALELENIAKTLSADGFASYLSAVSATDSSNKSAVRKQCLRLITIVVEHHGNALSPHLSKLLSAVTRRLRDADSAVRASCVTATAAISRHVNKPPFALIAKPFLEALFTEQEMNSQLGAALCLKSAVDAAPEKDVAALRKVMPRLERLLKSGSFKAKAALLTLIGSVIAVGGLPNPQTVKNLLPCLVEFVSSEDWAVRKAAVEALAKLAVAEGNALSEFKASCLKTFEAKKIDKVKAVRETMNEMLAAWKQIPDLPDEVSPPPESPSSSKEISTDGRHTPGSKVSCTRSSGIPQVRKSFVLNNKSSVADGFSAITAKKRSPIVTSARKTEPALFRKLGHKKALDPVVDLSAPPRRSEMKVPVSDIADSGEIEMEKGHNDSDAPALPETRRALFNKNSDERMEKLIASKAESHVVSWLDDKSDSIVSDNICNHHKNKNESEEISLIRNQLIQIENQQSSLLDLLQKFIGRSDSGMHSLESRVRGLELALEDISRDLAVKTGRMSNSGASRAICCKLPGTDFFTSKLWKRSESQSSTSRLPGSGTPLETTTAQNVAPRGDIEATKLENGRHRFQGGRAIILNPLAEIPQEISEASSSKVSKNSRCAAP